MTSQDDHLRHELEKNGVDLKPIAGWHPKRQQEWLVGRYLTHLSLPARISDLLLSPTGKPYFENSSLHFSISHSADTLGIIISEATIGLDIQIASKTIQKVSHKFITEENLKIFPTDMVDADRQHILWCTKEAVFKAYGLGSVDFKEDILVHSYDEQFSYSILKGRLKNQQVDRAYTAHYNRIGNYYIVAAILT